MIDWLFQESHARHSRGSLSDIRRASYAALPDSAVYASLRDWKTSRLTSRLDVAFMRRMVSLWTIRDFDNLVQA